MREIIFRGKSILNGEWLFGVPINSWWYGSCSTYMLTDGNVYGGEFDFDIIDKIIPETIGQYTGLKDCNGKMIFEGDILQGDDDIEDDVFHVARIGQSDENRYECFLDFNGDNKCWIPFIRYFNRMEIIGNIHEEEKK